MTQISKYKIIHSCHLHECPIIKYNKYYLGLKTLEILNKFWSSVPEVETGLAMTEEEFLTLYGFEKPKMEYPDNRLNVIYCQSGVRARKAVEIFEKFGYQNLRLYAGSFLDWLANGGEVVFD